MLEKTMNLRRTHEFTWGKPLLVKKPHKYSIYIIRTQLGETSLQTSKASPIIYIN